MKRFKGGISLVIAMVMILAIAGCAGTGATNTTATNVVVTSYESAGAVLSSAFNTEKTLRAKSLVTDAQHLQFMALYKKAYDCYITIGDTLKIVVSTISTTTQKTDAQTKVDALLTQLPPLISDIQKFIAEVSK